MPKTKKAPTTKKQMVKDDIGKYMSLEVLAKSEGGELLLTSLKKDIMASIDYIGSKFSTCTHGELIGVCAKLSERITLFRTISRSSKNKKLAIEELNLLLEEGDED